VAPTSREFELPKQPDLDTDTLDRLMVQVVRDNPEQVAGWITGKPGSWGFLAGQGVLACRKGLDRSLTEVERRRVWDRLWWLLEQVKASFTR
jgi:hypothetical protein